jgi:hypothetical protein
MKKNDLKLSNDTSTIIPKWVYMVGISLMIFTIFCFGIMVAGMIYV